MTSIVKASAADFLRRMSPSIAGLVLRTTERASRIDKEIKGRIWTGFRQRRKRLPRSSPDLATVLQSKLRPAIMYQVLKPVSGHIQCRGIERTFVSCRYPDTLR